jgi:hypothetical protein
MEISELRIGNFVSPINRSSVDGLYGYHILKIKENTLYFEIWPNCSINEVLPIQLNHNWLKYFKFSDKEVDFTFIEKFGNYDHSYEKHCSINEQNLLSIASINDKYFYIGPEAILSKDNHTYYLGQEIRYVHQLQNLYNYINGEELNYEKGL